MLREAKKEIDGEIVVFPYGPGTTWKCDLPELRRDDWADGFIRLNTGSRMQDIFLQQLFPGNRITSLY